MYKHIRWQGIEYDSVEDCSLQISDAGVDVKSTIAGVYKGRHYKVNYLVSLNPSWETLSFKILSRVDERSKFQSFNSDGKGNWFSEDFPAEDFTGCKDIDISLTPFTNSLPVNRLKLARKRPQMIRVIYIDILSGLVKPVEQRYEKLSAHLYRYQNVPNDFEADIEVDDLGLVIHYPGLFKRVPLTGSDAL